MSSLFSYLKRHHWGLIATFLSLGGTAYAVSALPPNSVGPRQIRRHAVTLVKIDPAAQRALRGRVGRTGRTGPPGPIGPSDGYFSWSPVLLIGQAAGSGATVTVPPGDYIATGGCTASLVANSYSPLTFGTATGILSATPTGQPQTTPYSANEPGSYGAITSVPNEGYAAPGHMGELEYAGAASLSESGGFSLPNGGTITETCRATTGNDSFAFGGGSTTNGITFSGYYLSAVRVATLHDDRSPINR